MRSYKQKWIKQGENLLIEKIATVLAEQSWKSLGNDAHPYGMENWELTLPTKIPNHLIMVVNTGFGQVVIKSGDNVKFERCDVIDDEFFLKNLADTCRDIPKKFAEISIPKMEQNIENLKKFIGEMK
jgi:hypothetical protein